MVKGIIVQFRRGRHRIHERHYLLDLDAKTREEAKKFAGKEVEWKSPSGKIIKGKITAAHGNNGIVRAIFEKGLPGQSITTEIEVKGPVHTEKKDKKEKK
jgi:large subunit ribosomal protein L35Ae